MPKTPSTGFKTEKNKEESSSLVHLYEFEYEPDEWLYLCDYDQDVTFPASSGGQLYTTFPITHDQLSENREGQVDQLQVSVANADRVIGGYVELYDGFRGNRLNIKTVFIGLLDDADAYIEDKYTIDSAIVSEGQCSFTCTSRLDVMDVQIPNRRFLNYCAWLVFKGPECLYSGSGTTCDRSLARCRELGNQVRFGGFPGCKMYHSI
jgi:lambda family phage minor tail protein L